MRAFLYGQWSQPSREQTGAGKPTVTVLLVVEGDGNVVSTHIIEPSGVPAMDQTVERMLAALKRVPAYTRFGLDGATRSEEVTFRLR